MMLNQSDKTKQQKNSNNFSSMKKGPVSLTKRNRKWAPLCYNPPSQNSKNKQRKDLEALKQYLD